MNKVEGKLVANGAKIGIVAARFNEFIVSKLVSGAEDALLRHDVNADDITVAWVPGAFEIPVIAKKMAASGKYDAVICLGAVIRGATSHYDYVCNEVSKGVASVSLETGVPVMFGVVTTENIEQAIAAHKLVEAPNGDLMLLSKENASNGSIGTVDITYPSAPLLLYYNPELCKALLNHIFYYSESGKWKKPFPAHDVGTYPQANGQTYKHDMPVEESGNMLVLTAAVAASEGNAEYARKHWTELTRWADYLVENGLDPDNQLCTDDFAGHFAHNANLSIKAIMGIASYGYCARLLGMEETAAKYAAKAREMASEWVKMADDGDHYRLTFDKSGTWSQKYNLVWDKLLGFDIFPKEVTQKEIAYYLGKQNRYGLPLDSRRQWTKADWIVWSATLADDRETFEAFIEPLWNFMNETVLRVPMSDWYKTDVPAHVIFKARAVVGGYWIKMLEGKYTNNK